MYIKRGGGNMYRSDVGQKQLMLFHIKRPEHAPGVMAHCMLQTVFTHASDRWNTLWYGFHLTVKSVIQAVDTCEAIPEESLPRCKYCLPAVWAMSITPYTYSNHDCHQFHLCFTEFSKQLGESQDYQLFLNRGYPHFHCKNRNNQDYFWIPPFYVVQMLILICIYLSLMDVLTTRLYLAV